MQSHAREGSVEEPRHTATRVPCAGRSQRVRLGEWIMFGLIVLSAAAVRLIYVSQTTGVPFARSPVGDGAGYLAWAERIAQGNANGGEPFYQAPLYPYALATLFSMGLNEVHWVRVFQALWGSVAAALVALAAWNWFGRNVGLLSGLVLALYAPAIFYDGLIQKASLACLLTSGLVALVSGTGSTSRGGRFLGLGVLSALLALTRENALVWIPLLLLMAVAAGGVARSARIKRGGFYLLGVLAVLGPVSVRNFALGGGFAPTTSQFGPNFYIGNREGADGLYHPLVRGHETPAFERADATRLAEAAAGRSLTAREVSRYWSARAWEDIGADPSAWLALMGRKILMVFNDYEVADAEGMIVYADASEILARLRKVLRFGVLFPLAAVGFFLYRAAWRELWIIWALILSMIGAISLFFILGRYRFPLIPLIVPFAATGCVGFIDYIRARRWREVLGAVVVGAISLLISHWPIYDVKRLDALARMNAGVALAQRGELSDALGYFERAVSGFPESPEANANYAQALAQAGEATGETRYFERAAMHYQRALHGNEALPGLQFNLGVALERLGRINSARNAYESALRANPDDTQARRALERLERR